MSATRTGAGRRHRREPAARNERPGTRMACVANVRVAAMIALVGDADPDELAHLAAKRVHRDRVRRATAARISPPGRTPVTENVESRDRAQTALAMSVPGPARSDDDRFAARMIASRRQRLGRAILRRAARQAVALLHRQSVRVGSARRRGCSRRISRRLPSRRAPRATGCSPNSLDCATSRSRARSSNGRRPTRSARTPSVNRAAAPCSVEMRRRVPVRLTAGAGRARRASSRRDARSRCSCGAAVLRSALPRRRDRARNGKEGLDGARRDSARRFLQRFHRRA